MTSDRKKMGREEIARVKAEYEASQDPIWVWWAYRVARERGLPCPAWVFAYLDRSAENLLGLTHPSVLPKKRAIAPAIEKALGFTSDARRTKRNPLDLGERDLALADCVYLHVVWHEDKLINAYAFAAEKFAVSRRTVERAWKKCEHSVTWRSAGESRWRHGGTVTTIKARRRALAKK